MRSPPEGYVTLSLLCRQPGCVVREFTGNFLGHIFGLAAGAGSLLPAIRREQ